MSYNQDLSAIFNRIANGEETERDMQTLRQLLRAREGQNSIQIGKYNVNIYEGRDIQIGDRIYQGADAEVIKEALRLVLQEKQKAQLYKAFNLGENSNNRNQSKFQCTLLAAGFCGSFVKHTQMSVMHFMIGIG